MKPWAVLAAAVPFVAFAQQSGVTANKPLTVCDALRQLNTINGQMISVRGVFKFTHRHGGWILDQNANGEPCPKMPRRARIWWSGIWLESARDLNLDGGPVSFSEGRPSYNDLIKMSDDLNKGDERNMLVTLTGEIRTKKDLIIVPAPNHRGDTMGNGCGMGGAFPAMLVIKTFGDVQFVAKPDRQ